MFAIILITAGLLAGLAALTLASQTFADGVSRAVEAAFDAAELPLARRERARMLAEREAAADRAATLASARPVSYARATGALRVTGALRATGPLTVA